MLLHRTVVALLPMLAKLYPSNYEVIKVKTASKMIVPDAKAYHSREPVVFKQSKIGSSDLELAFLSTPKNLSSLEQRYSLGIVQICFQPPELAVSDLLNIRTVTTLSALSTSTDATGVEFAILLFCELKEKL